MRLFELLKKKEKPEDKELKEIYEKEFKKEMLKQAEKQGRIDAMKKGYKKEDGGLVAGLLKARKTVRSLFPGLMSGESMFGNRKRKRNDSSW